MKCRFAPSPTGLLHVGNARSAVLNWAYCKKNNGIFVLRIDDTDQSRSTKEYENKIKENLTWLGLSWDKTFNQSDRIDNYNLKIEKLKKDGRLYPCFETAEELSLKKKSLLSAGKPPIYDRSSLLLSDEEIDENLKLGKKPHWRFKLDENIIEWNDLIKGIVKFEHHGFPLDLAGLNAAKITHCVKENERISFLHHLYENQEKWLDGSTIDEINKNIENILIDFQNIIKFASEKLKVVDSKGHYESDDETGFFFEEIKKLQNLLDDLFETEQEKK